MQSTYSAGLSSAAHAKFDNNIIIDRATTKLRTDSLCLTRYYTCQHSNISIGLFIARQHAHWRAIAILSVSARSERDGRTDGRSWLRTVRLSVRHVRSSKRLNIVIVSSPLARYSPVVLYCFMPIKHLREIPTGSPSPFGALNTGGI